MSEQNSNEDYAMEILLRDFQVVLFAICLGSLIMGLPLAWNLLWHLKVKLSNKVAVMHIGSSKKVPAKFSDTCSVRAGGLCIGCPKLIVCMKAGKFKHARNFFAQRCTSIISQPSRVHS